MDPVPENAGGQASPDIVEVSPEPAPTHSSGSPVAPGQRWHAYQIGDAIPAQEGWAFHAVNVGALEDVCLYIHPISEGAAARAEAWKKLQNGKYPGLIEVSDALEEDGYRFETTQVPPPATLREWANTHRASLDDVESLVRQLAAAVQAIHLVGVVHCNLSLDTVHLVTGDAGLKVLIGGLDRATLYEQPDLIRLPVNPLYAPPEAAGLTKHRPGPTLRAWDWWSLGRMMQELVLGQPVLGVVLDRDVSRMTPELYARAEELLLERDAVGPKAGAVEKMPSMSDDLASLLRGLLSSCRDGRWGWREVQAWLKRETVPDRYDLSRTDRLFVWQDRAFTVQDAAAFFSGEENWVAGVDHLFDVKNPASFSAFVAHEPELSAVRDQLDSLRDFVQLPAWREFPVEVVRTVIAAAAWQSIGEDGRPLLMKGRRVDAAFLKGLLKAEPIAEGVALVRAMIAPPFVQLITSRDATTARLLSVLSSTSTEIVTTAEKNGWLLPDDQAGHARVLLCSLEGEPDLSRQREELRKRYALVRHPQLDAIFKAPKSKHKELILLVFAAGDPERAGFVTQQEWNRDRYLALRERGDRLAAKLFWLRLGQLMSAAPLIFLRWPWVIGMWVGFAVVVSLLGPMPGSIGVGAALALVLFGLRVAINAVLRRYVMRYARDKNAAWTLRSGIERCTREAKDALPGDLLKTSAQVRAELATINREITALKLEGPSQPVQVPAHFALGWSGVATGWACFVILVGWAGWAHLPNGGRIFGESKSADVQRANNSSARGGKPKTQLTPEERFFSDPRTVYERWDFREPASAPPLPVRGYAKPTAEQVANALIDGQKLLVPYAPQTAQGVIAVPVSSGTEPGIMLYDVKRRSLLERRIFKLEQLPVAERSWHQLDSRKILYLGQPPLLNLEMWTDVYYTPNLVKGTDEMQKSETSPAPLPAKTP